MARHLIVENSKCQLTPAGTAGFVLANGSTSSNIHPDGFGAGGESGINQAIVEADLWTVWLRYLAN